MGTLHEDAYTFLIISRSVLLTMRNVSDRSCRENQNTHFTFNNVFFPRKSCRLWDNVEKNMADWPQMTILYDTCALHGEKIRLHARMHAHAHTQTRNMQYLLLFHNSGYANARQLYVYKYSGCSVFVFCGTFRWVWHMWSSYAFCMEFTCCI